jgi:hypothetical protein
MDSTKLKHLMDSIVTKGKLNRLNELNHLIQDGLRCEIALYKIAYGLLLKEHSSVVLYGRIRGSKIHTPRIQ